LRHRPGRGHGRGHRHRHDGRRDVRTAAAVHLVHRQGGGGMTSTTAPATTSPAAQQVPVRRRRSRAGIGWGIRAWVCCIGIFFPVLWMVLTAFKPEGDAYTDPPKLFFVPTLDQFSAVFSSGVGTPLLNSAFATIVSAILVLVLGIPAAFALS